MLWNAYVSLSLRTYIYIVISEHSSFIRRWNGMKVIWNYKSLLKRSFTLGDSRRIESFLYSWSIYTYSMYVHSILGNTIYWHLTLAKLEFFSKYIRFWFKLATLDIDIFYNQTLRLSLLQNLCVLYLTSFFLTIFTQFPKHCQLFKVVRFANR